MPDGTGKYYFADFKSELQARGFDGFSDIDLGTYVNRGYFHVARRAPWYWEETTDAFTIPAGSYSVPLWPQPSGELPNFRSLDKLAVTTAGQTKVLTPLSDEEFYPYLGMDLTSTQFRGEPSGYYIWQNQLYILRPPTVSRTFIAYYHQRVTAMVNGGDQPITPQHLDEAILLGALIRCHRRSNEPTLAAVAEADLDEFFDDMRDDEEMLMGEKLDRVRPDDTWL